MAPTTAADRSEIPGDRKSRTHQALIAATVEVAARVGYAGASVEQIITAAEVSRSTFYEHFSDRNACFLAALDFVGSRLLGELESDAGRSDPLLLAVEAPLRLAAKDPAAARLLTVESLAGCPKALDRRARIERQLEALIESSRPEETGGEIDLASETMVGGVFRLLAIRFSTNFADQDEDLEEGVRDWLRSYGRGSARIRCEAEGENVRLRPLPAQALPELESLKTLSADHRRRGLTDLPRSRRLRVMAAVADRSYEAGYSRLTVAEITATAGISRKAFYELFRDKAQAATEANQRFFQAAMTAAAGEFFAGSNWPERIWAAGVGLLSFFARHPAEAYLGFVETHAIGEEAVQLTYERLAAFTLFLEEGYRWRPEAENLSRICSQALMATMFELAFRELYERRSAEQLLSAMPRFAYTILAPFIGPEAAADFVTTKLETG